MLRCMIHPYSGVLTQALYSNKNLIEILVWHFRYKHSSDVAHEHGLTEHMFEPCLKTKPKPR